MPPTESCVTMTTQRFQRACDASAAVRVADTAFFMTATDEDYVLRVYDRNSPGPPIAELDVTTFLEPVNPQKEPDIEGSAQIGDRVYWIGSHGRDKDGEEQESRQRLFATDVEVIAGRPSLRTVGRPYKKLLSDLVSAASLAEFDLLTAATLKPEDPGGLNIEGLAATAEGHLLVGFRNPVPASRALIVRIENPGDVVMGTAAPKVRKAALLDLGGRGCARWSSRGTAGSSCSPEASTTRRTSRCFSATVRMRRRRWCSMLRRSTRSTPRSSCSGRIFRIACTCSATMARRSSARRSVRKPNFRRARSE